MPTSNPCLNGKTSSLSSENQLVRTPTNHIGPNPKTTKKTFGCEECSVSGTWGAEENETMGAAGVQRHDRAAQEDHQEGVPKTAPTPRYVRFVPHWKQFPVSRPNKTIIEIQRKEATPHLDLCRDNASQRKARPQQQTSRSGENKAITRAHLAATIKPNELTTGVPTSSPTRWAPI